MNAKTLTVVALFKSKPGKENQLRKLLSGLIAPSRKDAGCVNYDLHQSVENPAQFMFHENWDSKALLDSHLQTAHVQGALSQIGDLVSEPPQITLWEKI